MIKLHQTLNIREYLFSENVKVRFFELDDEETEIWSDFGKFNELDVHHQYAIAFK